MTPPFNLQSVRGRGGGLTGLGIVLHCAIWYSFLFSYRCGVSKCIAQRKSESSVPGGKSMFLSGCQTWQFWRFAEGGQRTGARKYARRCSLSSRAEMAPSSSLIGPCEGILIGMRVIQGVLKTVEDTVSRVDISVGYSTKRRGLSVGDTSYVYASCYKNNND
jgi:hypothetical protein